jgi:hypothetical protein
MTLSSWPNLPIMWPAPATLIEVPDAPEECQLRF